MGLNKDLVGIREAAKQLGVSIPTLRRWDRSGRLEAVRDPQTGERLYRLDALEAAARGARVSEGDEIIGRAPELRKVLSALSAAPVVTIAGPGGIGKTTLAKRALAGLSKRTFFCDLTTVDDARVLSVFAASLGIADAADEARIARHLARVGDAVVAIDNAEHVAKTVAGIVRRLRRPKIAFLVTSRERLRVPGEVVVELGPLAWQTDAVALLLRVAGRAGATIDARKHAAVLGHIARRLDGIPLAIELAGARLAMFAPDTLLALLGDQLDVLVDRRRTERHATLRAAIAWSYALLDAKERALLADLSVFRGGFDVPAVLAIGGSVGTLEALRDKSMVRAIDAARFDLYVSIRDFAAEQLGRSDAPREHARHYGRLARAALDAPPSDVAVDVLVPEHENLRTALAWASSHDRELALLLAIAVDYAAGATTPIEERVRLLDKALRGTRGPLVARALATRGRLLLERGDRARADRDLENARRAAVRAKDASLEEYVLGLVAVSRVQWGTRKQALDAVAAAEKALRRSPDRAAHALTWAALGSVQHEIDTLEAAERTYAHALALARREDQPVLAARIQARLGRVFCDEGRLDDAKDALRAIETLRGDRFEAWAIAHRALLRWRENRLDDAREDYARAVELFEARGSVAFEMLHRTLHAASLCALGRGVDALAEIERARMDAPDEEGITSAIALAEAHRSVLDARRAGRDAVSIAAGALERHRHSIERDKDVRALAERLRAAATSAWPTSPCLVVANDGAWLTPPGKPRAHLPAGSPLRPLLRALAGSRGTLPREALVAAAWPREKMLPRAAAQRVYAAMSELRSLGLGDALERTADGYRIAGDVRTEGDHR